ncbi:hypothetical protein A2369_02710 [candidate division WS6 bacterium RIFOXYB1_FULL_33_15]|nr:MAG: hypothetical protein A2369_02710 [candidate division WS6 bacterium RIFOXYB1_FULL_33_15]
MYKRIKKRKLGRTSAHRKALIQNQLRSVMQNGKIETSSVKAKVLKAELESIFSKVKTTKEGDLPLLRKLYTIFGDKELVKKIFLLGKKDVKISTKKIGFRAGDNTEVSTVEIVGFKVREKSKKEVEKKVEKKEEIIEEKPIEEDVKRKGILNIGGRKSGIKKVEPMKKERARTRSGL